MNRVQSERFRLRFLSALCVFCCVWTCSAQEFKPLPLANELPIGGPEIQLLPGFGYTYRPGEVFMLEGLLRASPSMDGASGRILAYEGNRQAGTQYGIHLTFSSQTERIFRFPVRIPAGASRLQLSVSKDLNSGLSQELFYTTTIGRLIPLTDDERLVWLCGEATLHAPLRWRVQPVAPRMMPEQDEYYAGLDLLVLANGALEEVPAITLQVIRRWLFSGGRLMTVTPQAFYFAVQQGWLPWPVGTAPADVDLRPDGLQSVGITEAQIVRDERLQPVFATYELDRGGGLFFFPSATFRTQKAFWERAISNPILNVSVMRHKDARLQQEPFEFFAPGMVSESRRDEIARFTLIAALALIVLLCFAARCSTYYMSAGIALFGIGLPGGILVNRYPIPEGTRLQTLFVDRAEHSLHYRNYVILEGVRQLSNVSTIPVRSHRLQPLYATEAELHAAAVKFDAETLNYSFRPDAPTPPAPLFLLQALNYAEAHEYALGLHADRALDLTPYDRQLLEEHFGGPPAAALWIDATARRPQTHLLLEPLARKFEQKPYQGTLSAVKEIAGELTDNEQRAHSKALNVAVREIMRNKEAAIVFFSRHKQAVRAPELEFSRAGKPLHLDNGPVFSVWKLPLKIEKR